MQSSLAVFQVFSQSNSNPMPKKTIKHEKKEAETVLVVVSQEKIQPVSESYGREDLNALAKTVNLLIERVNNA